LTLTCDTPLGWHVDIFLKIKKPTKLQSDTWQSLIITVNCLYNFSKKGPNERNWQKLGPN